MRSPPPPPPPPARMHRRESSSSSISRNTNGGTSIRRRPILPVIYAQPKQSRFCTPRNLSLMVVGSCGIWIFAMGAMIERLPPGRGFPTLLLSDVTAAAETIPTITITPESTTSSNNQVVKKKSTLMRDHLQGKIQDTQLKQQERRRNSEFSSDGSQLFEVHHHDEPNNSHRIPKVLIFTHAINLLTYKPPTKEQQQSIINSSSSSSSSNKTLEEVLADQAELVVLQQNVQRTIEMHRDATVRFLTDDDCITSLQAVLGPSAPLIDYFQQESQGMYKADICRGAALWETGGIYLDVDVGVRMPLWGSQSEEDTSISTTAPIHANTTFATNFVHRDSNYVGSFFQAFMASTPNHKIMEQYLHLFLLHYQGKLTKPIKKGPLGVILLRQAFDDVILNSPGEIQQIDLKDYGSLPTKEKYFQLGPKVLDTRNYGRVQLWQEIQYTPKYFPNVLEPTWGTRRACRFVVVADKKFPLTVPFYSRIAGSRICPESTSDQ